jgi:protein tyrosine phosphatase (PTP) superfamily phosphohydrolase (DUF442 family)
MNRERGRLMRGALNPLLAAVLVLSVGGSGSQNDGAAAARNDRSDPRNTAAGDTSQKRDSSPATTSDTEYSEPLEIAELENLRRLSPNVYSGGEPKSAQAFEELANLGVRTVVSVDGARPAVESARAAGLRYVHIPIGYDGIPDEAAGALTRLARDTEGPIYIHCHHGKHRGPAAAAIVCRAAGHVGESGATNILEQAGTSRDYAGLWRDVAGYEPPPADAKLPELVEVAKVDSLAAAMAAIDRAFDKLKLCREAGWQTPAAHPDLVPSREAVLLYEGFREAGRNLADGCDETFRTWLSESESAAATLQAALDGGLAEKAAPLLTQIDVSCKRCHDRYRN